MTPDERQPDPITDHSVPADADFQAAGTDEAGSPSPTDDSADATAADDRSDASS